jgi:serine/threonine protein kinase
VTRDGIPKLLDFGIAKLADPAQQDLHLTVTGMRVMTPGYASPEQVRGEAVTAATDVYSLGAVLYELLTGKRPYAVESSSPAAMEREICERDPRPPSAWSREVDADLDNIILKAMRKEPDRPW